MSYLSDIWDDFISLLFPRLCSACGEPLVRNEKTICTECYIKIPRTDFHLQRENPVEKLFWGRCRIEKGASFSYFNRDSRIREAIHTLKYKGHQEVGFELGRIYGLELLDSDFISDIDMIVPVPLHERRRKERGFNQSETIANGISSVTHIMVNTHIISRLVASATQTRKDRLNRWSNVDGIFGVIDYPAIQGKHILLIDDVITTGSTIEACCNELLKGEGVKVSVASIAVALE